MAYGNTFCILTNVLGLFSVGKLFMLNQYRGSLLVFGSVIMSTVMNSLSCCPYINRFSKQICDGEKVVALTTGCYGLYLFYANPFKTLWQVILPVIGLCVFYGKEYVED